MKAAYVIAAELVFAGSVILFGMVKFDANIFFQAIFRVDKEIDPGILVWKTFTVQAFVLDLHMLGSSAAPERRLGGQSSCAELISFAIAETELKSIAKIRIDFIDTSRDFRKRWGISCL